MNQLRLAVHSHVRFHPEVPQLARVRQVRDFRTDLGPRPRSEIRNEDTEFGSRLLAGGERLWYELSAVVYHSVPEHRVQKKYLLAWWFDKARVDIREHGIAKGTK